MEPIAGKLMESKNLPPPSPLSTYILWAYDGETWEWDGGFNELDSAKQYAAKQYAAANYVVYRIIHNTDQPPQLPDKKKLVRHIYKNALLDIGVTFEALSRDQYERAYMVADAVLALMRDGIPPELMPD